jgi:protease IV
VVLRVNSPGGSALASDVMWRELTLLKKAGKPLIVSMGGYAASGGYYISAPADFIFAQPTTLTGSIGVFGLFFTGEQLLEEKMGINTDTVKTNQYADIMTLTRVMTPQERTIVQKEVDRIYNDFIQVVAEGRKRPVADIDSIAQGRVWTGKSAKDIGLVDELGGLEDALLYAAKQISKNNQLTSNPYTVVEYPETDKELSEFLKQLSSEAEATSMNQHFGEYYQYYNTIKEAVQRKGIQMRMEYDIYIY